MKNENHDELVAQQTRESIATRMEAFADEFLRLARLPRQAAVAESFSHSVHGIVARHPLTAADLEPLGKWLSGNADQFEQLAKTSEQKELAAAFRGFIREITSREVKDAFQRPLVNELVLDVEWEMAEGADNGVPFAHLSREDKKAYLAVAIDWSDYLDRGLGLEADRAAHIDRIIENVIAGKPREEWMGRNESLREKLAGMLDVRSDRVAKAAERQNDRGSER
jgi:hypothetical protein